MVEVGVGLLEPQNIHTIRPQDVLESIYLVVVVLPQTEPVDIQRHYSNYITALLLHPQVPVNFHNRILHCLAKWTEFFRRGGSILFLPLFVPIIIKQFIEVLC